VYFDVFFICITRLFVLYFTPRAKIVLVFSKEVYPKKTKPRQSGVSICSNFDIITQ